MCSSDLPNPKPQTPNPKPQTPNPILAMLFSLSYLMSASIGYTHPPGYILNQQQGQPITLNSDVIDHLKDIFCRCDRNSSGLVNHSEFKQALDSFGITGSFQVVNSLVAKFDQNQKGSLNFTEFCNVFLAVLRSYGLQTGSFMFR